MTQTLNEEQRSLQDTAQEFLAANAPVEQLRALRDNADELGYSPELWRQMAELGWAGILIPEQYGGADFGFTGLALILQESGRTLAASPLFATALVGASLVLRGGTKEQKQRLLPGIAAGDLTLALALEEGPHHKGPAAIATRAKKSADGYVLKGEKTFVLDGHSAQQLIVAARTDGKPGDTQGVSLFLVDGDAKGLTRTRTLMVDSRNAANVSLSGVKVGADALLGTAGQGTALLEEVLDLGRIGMAAEMLGSTQELFRRTLEYLKERKQFGVPIGSFQALKHRAAEMFCQVELTRSAVLEAMTAVDEGANEVPQLASLAKSITGDTYHLLSNEAVQMHGGMGVTDELDMGLFLKRARVAEQVFGSAAWHRDRYAELAGY